MENILPLIMIIIVSLNILFCDLKHIFAATAMICLNINSENYINNNSKIHLVVAGLQLWFKSYNEPDASYQRI